MTINKYVKVWFDEEYDTQFEDFYIENAKWTLDRCWGNLVVTKGILILFVTFMCWNFRMPLLDVFYGEKFPDAKIVIHKTTCDIAVFSLL